MPGISTMTKNPEIPMKSNFLPRKAPSGILGTIDGINNRLKPDTL